MAQVIAISTKELKRQAELVFEGKTIEVMLCSVGESGFTVESTFADWESVEITGSGYTRFSDIIGTGSYNYLNTQYELPVINAEFAATGGDIIYDTIIIHIDGETYIHSLITESPNIVLSSGQTQTYSITLSQDD
jgi:hypothetical protein